MKDFPKIELPPAIGSKPTPVQFLPSTMLSWRAPIIPRRKLVERMPEAAEPAGA